MKNFVLALIILISFTDLNAQTQVLNNVLSAKTRGTGAIIKENTVMGYYSFYELDKKDRKTRNYQLSIYDQNLAHYLMGVGDPKDMRVAIENGIALNNTRHVCLNRTTNLIAMNYQKG